MSGGPVLDDGLGPERTALAWRRTGLSFAAASLVAVRILPELLGTWSVIPAGLGVLASILIIVLAHRRHHAVHRALIGEQERSPLPSGTLPLLTAVITLAGGGVALLIVLHLVITRGR
ncbi:DUF202 domain-containing protein [Microlunatus elymi]|uniref:DUF202 domain-containing protein n=1 Tax=Microlunatus elymi TaxID=2596828 RepID=A0A516PZS3_9ACTN|nr:DUF202 domain-containing protein [Microlunatus elymi]QDP96670.1 DUF202 domain-containing protein [Microlunatus elymi]